MFRLTVKSGRSIIRLPCGTKFLMGSNVCDFSSDPQNKFRQKKKKKKKIYIYNKNNNTNNKKIIIINTANISPAKIYSRVNIRDLKFATQK